ncbi:hypothetical protein SXCC_02662 [Gluconacetobacter sp. SXCC-1]|nr:hypothetical protein SXCC_02662 [Gluconacetobacter sp. SXCC-1]
MTFRMQNFGQLNTYPPSRMNGRLLTGHLPHTILLQYRNYMLPGFARQGKPLHAQGTARRA